eukprot:CAMPEP_0173179124 /NCGR_PEP_ID=MMETSP1141-20130122/5933_1 /TAXON_ID=483371 /ORGANISM="non described non described, Strain CCMP2298" /LENGTH=111 /DNA_ID=CAMNT_0014101723 /DNA_START=308 /DNA_END=643 /DNA_ORIENTATION=-
MVSTGIPVDAAVASSTALWPAGVSEAVGTPVRVRSSEKETMGVVCWEATTVGRKLGLAEGAEGCTEGIAEGCEVGCVEGTADGCADGCADGLLLGCELGTLVGCPVGEPDG